MALVRHAGAKITRFLASSHPVKRSVFVSIFQAHRRYGSEPAEYDYTHLEGQDQVQAVTTPLTPEKRAQLSAKYNLRPEDYEPLSDGYVTLGDYPKLPRENCLERDPFYDWDDPFHRRNWGEPIFHEIDAWTPVIGVDTRPLPYDRRQMWPILIGFFGINLFLFWLGGKFPSFLPRAPKQYPEHYPTDDVKIYKLNYYDYMENRGTLDAKVKEKVDVVHYTFPKNWDPAAH